MVAVHHKKKQKKEEETLKLIHEWRIGFKCLSLFIIIYKGKFKWHTGKASISLWLGHWDKKEEAWAFNWCKHIPIGKKYKG